MNLKKERRQAMPRLWQLLAAVTRPDLIVAVGIGVALAIGGQLALDYQLGWYVLAGLLVLFGVFAIGAFVGYYVSGVYARRLRESVVDRAAELTDALGLALRSVVDLGAGRFGQAEADALQPALREITARAQDAAGWGAALLARAFAFGRMATILGAAVSFAIFLATYMQVEKLDLQNQLIEASNHLQEAARRNMLSDEIRILNEALPQERGMTLPPGVIDGIVNLSVGLRPYRFLRYEEADLYKAVGVVAAESGRGRLSDRALSAERGRLLLRILQLKPANLRDLAEARPDFSHADLRATRMRQLDFSHLFLGYSDFRDAEGFLLAFRGAQLPHADFEGAELLGADFSKPEQQIASLRSGATDLRAARFVAARLNKAKFAGADLRGADLSDAVLFGTSFEGANLAGATLRGAALWGADNEEEVKTAVAAYQSLLQRLPDSERRRWTYEIREPAANHKYLGTASPGTRYLFVREVSARAWG